MLKTLTVWNFALLEHVEIEFSAGLNILTGETGAGKSILIDALGAVLGRRLTGDFIRTGCEWLRVEAVFDISGQKDVKEILSEQAIDADEDTLIITRQYTTKGKNSILVNGCHVTIAFLKSLGEALVDIHGQHENLSILKQDNQRYIVDHSNTKVYNQLKSYETVFSKWKELLTEIEEKKEKAANLNERLDMLRWQDQEIEQAQLTAGEEVELEADIKRLSNSERITENVEKAYCLFDGTEESEGILSAVARVRQCLEQAGRFEEQLSELVQPLEDASYQLQDIFYSVRNYKDALDFDPKRLDDIQNRMDQIDKLRKKYGSTVEEVLLYQKKIRQELEDMENFDANLEADEQKLKVLHDSLMDEGNKLTEQRKTAADKLSSSIQRQLKALGMQSSQFRIMISESEPTLNGLDEVSIQFSANEGEKEKSLAKTASGGELSRIALAIKTVSAQNDDSVGSMIFDEIDTGIGGETAQMVAERIAWVGFFKQVLCITHLPQIACMADAHYHLYKEVNEGKTVTSVKKLSRDERIREVARMASGKDISKAALTSAEEMIEHAYARKESFRKRK